MVIIEKWQLTHEEIYSGALALAACKRCGGSGVTSQMVLNFEGDDLVEVDQRVACGCRDAAMACLAEACLPGGRFKAAALGSLNWKRIAPARTRASVQLYAQKLDEMLAQGVGLMMVGGVGTGKTHVAVGLVKLAAGMGVDARFAVVPDLLARIKATYGGGRRAETESAIVEELSTVQFLALDDVGAEQPTDWVRERLYTIVNRRYNAGLPIVTTSNEDEELLAKKLGRRIVSRLVGTSLQVEFSGADYRTQARDHLLEELGVGWADTWIAAQ